jgi:hypothetical protein
MRERFPREVSITLVGDIWQHVKETCASEEERDTFIQEALRCYVRCRTRESLGVPSSAWMADPARCEEYSSEEWARLLAMRFPKPGSTDK